MPDIRGRIRHRSENKAESVCYTYKQHFAAATFYRNLSLFLDTAMFGCAALILATNFWSVMPNRFIAIPALAIAAVTGCRRATNLDDVPGEFRRSANEYHSLFDEYRDFLTVTLASDDADIQKIQSEFERLSGQRRRLNQKSPDASSIWYQYIKWKGEDKIREEITTTSATREALSGKEVTDSSPLDDD
ncbi:hypothetical protein N0B31_22305 (plasmid) [Salinirubellus salinus]|uniref:SLATT domain-containing protein n=1 Tax=Salinirubellus salinus TaxID=1364945 RepID=A0A9E7R7Q8_9EURY|nr:hypothetical protein [Salinirubellus salinus]UWM56981.1 hypothetical protein N0B31_22305 [Salinirubellus salinus]